MLSQILERPVTSVIVIFCTAVWAWLNHNHLGYQDVGLSYDLFIDRQHFWRIVTSQLSHVDFIHLLFNMSSLWSLGVFEQGGTNSIVFLQQSLWLLVGSGLVRQALFHHVWHNLDNAQFLVWFGSCHLTVFS